MRPIFRGAEAKIEAQTGVPVSLSVRQTEDGMAYLCAEWQADGSKSLSAMLIANTARTIGRDIELATAGFVEEINKSVAQAG